MKTPWAALHPLRIGCVQYLNSKPLIHDYEGEVIFDHPSALARELAAGRLDAALVPVFEILRNPVYALVDEVAIACRGPVHSVVLAYRGPLTEIQSVALDPASLTSAHLLKVLLAEFYGLQPDIRGDGESMLIIGNQAIEFRAAETRRNAGWSWMDLGEEWYRQTGFPFVFAAWALRPDLENGTAVADGFRALKQHGLARIGRIISDEPIGDETFRRRYLTEHIHFDLGGAEKNGLAHFRSLLWKWHLISADDRPIHFI
ncbi:MAG: menaquinone biosynthesis protein [Chthoniobacteraceae bacterium]